MRFPACICCAAFCAAFCAALGCLLEIGISHLQVVLHGYARGVAQPSRDYVNRVFPRQFRFPACPKVVEQPRPGLQAGPLHRTLELGPEITVPPSASADKTHGQIGRVRFPRVLETCHAISLGTSRSADTPRRGSVVFLRRCGWTIWRSGVDAMLDGRYDRVDQSVTAV